ncbi:MAG TPA: FlgD immunoglobulin-like domain containing protein, partial [Flavobacteriales bacterium]|nr:FlgD immunoglobulin-like domain containing protein [Flavobacteriales bacterium]
WTSLTSGLPPSADFGFTSVSICDAFPNVLYAGVSYPEASPACGEMRGFYKTSDGGATWTALSPSYDFYCYPPPFDNICQGWYGNITSVSPVDTNIVFTGGVYLYKTFDAGANWYYYDYSPAELDYPWVHPDHHSFGWDPQNPNTVYAFCDGGVYKSTNQGYHWYLKNNGLVTTQFYYIASSATNPNIALCGTQDNGSWCNLHLDTSKTWKQFQTGDGFMVSVDYGNENVWYGSELYAGRFRITLNGDSVEQRNSGIISSNYFTTPFVMHPTNRATFFTATDSEIYRTDDTCHNWTSVYGAPYMIAFAFDHVNPDIIYTVQDPYFTITKFCRSLDGGSTWLTGTLPMNKVIDIECHPDSSGVLFAVRSSYNAGENIWKSVDYGATWTNISGDFPGVPANAICIDPHNTQHLYAGTDLGMYLSIDGGHTWNSFNDNLPNVMVTDIHYYEPDGTIRIGTHGRGYWMTKAFVPDALPDEFGTCFNNTRIFPNPLTDQTMISFSLSSPSSVTIKIYNNLGQCIHTLYNQKNGAGAYTVTWDGNNSNGVKVAAGVYYVRMICEETARTVKLNVSR